ncbi:fibronectin type III domain-containing protein [Paenibacillus sp. PR3]|uniref:Fibronectin type III domain-containing protein n=1 Tax=Paenibacillus terricola TaxID=2763503 RepID=A0ABR8MSR5_9BACL|nr:fibronectin type III domain-containing protein [Paenibacillus terricola]MBD3917194.1 fibronectin type III domain-containing protein [Paenibacillus terricola]
MQRCSAAVDRRTRRRRQSQRILKEQRPLIRQRHSRGRAPRTNVGVTGYNIGELAAISTTTSCTVTGLKAKRTYSFTVRAIDAAGNQSAASAAVSVTTPDSCPFDYDSEPDLEGFHR